MSQALNTFKKWFENQDTEDQLKIAQYIQAFCSNLECGIYGGPAPQNNRGYYAGPVPNTHGVYGGPVPKNYSRICPTCGRPQ